MRAIVLCCSWFNDTTCVCCECQWTHHHMLPAWDTGGQMRAFATLCKISSQFQTLVRVQCVSRQLVVWLWDSALRPPLIWLSLMWLSEQNLLIFHDHQNSKITAHSCLCIFFSLDETFGCCAEVKLYDLLFCRNTYVAQECIKSGISKTSSVKTTD